MHYKEYAVNSFSGGLITTESEAVLDKNMSPNLQNVDIGDNGSFERRTGYRLVKNAAGGNTDKEVNHLSRIYWNDGTMSWVVICGTQLMEGASITGGERTVTVDLNAANVSATDDEYLSGFSWAMNGSMVVSSTKQTFTVPTSTQFSLYMKGVTGSIKVDSGSYVSLSASNVYVSATSPSGSHTVIVKPKLSDGSAVKMHRAASGGTEFYQDVGWGSYPEKYTEVSIYDDGTTTVPFVVALCYYDYNGMHPTVGIDTSASQTHYALNGSATSVARTVGWHKFRLSQDGDQRNYYIDGVLVGKTYCPLDTILHFYAYKTTAQDVFIDRIVFDGMLANGCSATHDWNIYSGVGSTFAVVTATHDDSNDPIALDYVSAYRESDFTRAASVSASANTFAIDFSNGYTIFGTDYNKARSLTSAGVVASIPNADEAGFMCLNQTRMFYAGQYDNKTLVQFSAPLDALNLSGSAGTGVFRLAASGGSGDCTALVSYQHDVYYFSYSQTFKLDTGDNNEANFLADDISPSHGCIAPRSMAVGDSGMAFLSADGVRGYGAIQSVFANDGSGFSMLSYNIAGLNQVRPAEYTDICASASHPEASSIYGYSAEERAAAVGAIYKNVYWLFIGDDVYTFDLRAKSINDQPVVSRYKFAGLDSATTRVTAACVTRGDEYGLYVGTKDGSIYQLDSGQSDNEDYINWYYDTPPLYQDGKYSTKHYRTMYVNAGIPPTNSPTATQQITVDLSTDDAAYDPPAQTLTVNTNKDPIRIPISSKGHYMKVRFSGVHKGEPVNISSMSLLHTSNAEVK